MKTFFFLLLLILSEGMGRCELLIFQKAPYPAWNVFTVAENQVAFIDLFDLDSANDTAKLVVNGRTNDTSIGYGSSFSIGTSHVMVGPSQIQFHASCLFQYRMFTNSGNFGNVLLYPGESINLTVGDHQVIRFLKPIAALLGGSSSKGVGGTFVNGSGSLLASVPIGNEVDGPLAFSSNNNSTPQFPVIFGFVYYIGDASIALPAGTSIQAMPGAMQLRVDKSADFQTWTPSIIQAIAPEQKTFYRITVDR